MNKYKVTFKVSNPRTGGTTTYTREVLAESDAMAVEQAKGQHFGTYSTHRNEGWGFHLVKVERR
ncbi:hypothetical protein CO611_00270 [Lysobacteraceae bacterium NML03-0222]|nr:hypothetical protein CO611_00270 [Xanthomonadaceae bacterium NML03-0222]